MDGSSGKSSVTTSTSSSCNFDLGSMLSRQFLNNMITKLYNLFASVFNYFLMQNCMLV